MLARRMRRYAQTTKGKLSKWKSGLKYKFGINEQKYNSMFRRQKGLCKLCGNPLPSNRHAQVDHNHDTGKVRGLVHLRCNLVIGTVEKWGELVKKYLRKTNQKQSISMAKTH